MAQAKVDLVINAKDNASGVLKNFGSTIANAATMVATASAAAVAAVATVGIKVAADLETARQGFVGLGITAEDTDALLEQIKKDAASTPFEFTGLVKANQLLTSVTKDGAQSERLLLNVGKALATAGKGGEELDNVIFNLQQIANTGQITEMDIRQFGMAGINILELLADHYGVTKEEANEMVKNSENAFVDLEGAFIKAGEGSGKFADAFTTQQGTFNQLFSNLKDNFNVFAADFVTTTGLFDFAKGVVGGLSGAFGFLSILIKNVITDLKAYLKPAFDEISKAWNDAWPQIKEGFDTILSVMGENKGAQADLKEGFKDLVGGAVFGIKQIIAGLVTAAKWIKDNRAFISDLISTFATLAKFGMQAIGFLLGAFGAFYREAQRVQTIIWDIYKAITNIGKAAQNGIVGAVKGVGNFLGLGGGKDGGVVQSIPKFAGGGIVPGVSISGDQVLARLNSGEVVMPADKFDRLMAMIDSGGIGGGQVVFAPNIPYYAGDAAAKTAIAEDIWREIERMARAKGVDISKLSLLGQ